MSAGIVRSWGYLPDGERKARLRALQCAVRLCCGATADTVANLLLLAEDDSRILISADVALSRLPTLGLRRALSSYARTLPGADRSGPDLRGEEIADEFKNGWRRR